MDNSQFMTVHQLAELFGVKPHTIYSARARGELPPCIKAFGRLMWMRTDIDDFLDTQINRDLHNVTRRRLDYYTKKYAQ